MDRATYNTIRLKAYYWEKQILRGRDDQNTLQQFANYSEQLEKAKELLAAERQKKREQRQEEAAARSLQWRKNVRHSSGSKGYDAWTQAALSRSLTEWKPQLEMSFD